MKTLQLLAAVIFIGLFSSSSKAQEIATMHELNNKGKLYFFWGWNRGSYTSSDITFTGNGYNFTLSEVVAKDRQTPFEMDTYLNPMNMTIPQTNLRVGYYFNKKYDVSFGIDHMKYVMVQDQKVKINGTIQNTNTPYDKVYNNESIVLTQNFLTFEHTDGLNYLNFALNRQDRIIDLKKLNISNVTLSLKEGFGAGILLPRTNSKFLNYNRHDEFHLAGYGVDLSVGLNLTFFDYFFVQSETKTGFINMPDIRTTEFEADRAKQHFFFFQRNIVFGAIFPISGRKIRTL